MATFQEVFHRYEQFGQAHIFRWYDSLSAAEQRNLLAQAEAIDPETVAWLYRKREDTVTLPRPKYCQPIPTVRLTEDRREEARIGEQALKKGKVGFLVVAGGQGSRLGFPHPKGMFPIGPLSGKSLFQMLAEKILALSRRLQQPLTWLVMTSPVTDAATRAYFGENRCFGLSPKQIVFFCQGTLPAVDKQTGKLLLADKGNLFLSPNGHGGTLTALGDSGLLTRLQQQGIEQLFYFQVDNPLVDLADTRFIGHHIKTKAQVSSKAVEKQSPEEKTGTFLLFKDRCSMIEYSDMPETMASERNGDGHLQYRWANPAIHLFNLAFLKQVYQSAAQIPFHIARKKVPYINDKGQKVQPEENNAYKFEMFIFDLLPMAERWAVVETTREQEFAPVKNAEGPDSPLTAKQLICDDAALMLEKAGVTVPRKPSGRLAVPVEVSPLFALDAEELARKVRDVTITGPTYLSEKGILEGIR